MSDRELEEVDLGQAEPEHGPPPVVGGSRRAWLVAGLAILTVLLVVGGAGFVWVQRQLDPPGDPGEEVVVEIAEGTSAQAIGERLDEEGVITSATVWRWYLRLRGGGPFQAGKYTFRERMSVQNAIGVLAGGPELAFERVTIPEGLTVEEIADRVDSVSWLSGERFLELAGNGAVRSAYQPDHVTTLEGLLFPDTYFVDETEDERALLTRMVEALDRNAAELGYDRAPELVGLSPYEALVVASLIEREARIPDERPKVAAVVYNRLERDMLLEIDATVLYALGEHRERVLYRDLEVDSPWNTYRYAGLPPTPIAAPGRASLEAALAPAQGEWLYYVVIDESGRHAFAEDFAGHQRNIREAERRGVR